jgi:hypothetical protein
MIPIECENTFPIAGLQLKNWGNNCGKLAHVDVLGFGIIVVFELSLKSVQPISSIQPANPAEVRIEQFGGSCCCWQLCS